MAVTDYKGPAFDSSELNELKAKVVNGCLILDREGITDGFGHVSVRIPEQAAFLTIAQVSPGCAALDKAGSTRPRRQLSRRRQTGALRVADSCVHHGRAPGCHERVPHSLQMERAV